MKDRSDKDADGSASRQQGIGRDTRPLKGLRRSSVQPPRTRRGLTTILLVSIGLLVAAAVGAWYWLGVVSEQQNHEAPLTPPISLDLLITEYPELESILSDSKIDSVYKEFLVAYETGGGDAALDLASKRGLLNSEGDLRLTLELDTTDTAPLEVELEANFIEVTAVNGNLMDIAVPVRRLELVMASGSVDDLLASLTNLEHVQRIRLPIVSIVDTPDRQPLRVPQLTFMPTPVLTQTLVQTPTPQPFSFVPEGGFQTPNNAIMVTLAILLCLVAPALFFLGGFLLLMGLGMVRRDDRRPKAQTGGAAPIIGRETGRTTLQSGSHSTATAGAPAVSAQVVPTEGTAAGPSQPPTAAQSGAPPSAEAAQGKTLSGVQPGTAQPQVVCLSCGRINRSGARYCAACGADLLAPDVRPDATPGQSQPPLETSAAAAGKAGEPGETKQEAPTFCWNCGRRLRPTSRFCPFCGDRV